MENLIQGNRHLWEGKTISISTRRKEFIEDSEVHKKVIVEGPTACGKTTLLMERYKYMVENLGIPSQSILVLVLNQEKSIEWRSNTAISRSGALLQTSFYGFIQSQLKLFYPIVLKNCSKIIHHDLEPTFMSYEVAHYLISKAIEGRREKGEIFSNVTTITDKIAMELTENIAKAATSGIPFREIGDRLYHSLEKKEIDKKQVFKEVDLVISAYHHKCLELGLLDFGLAIHLYMDYLFQDEEYKNQLFKGIAHLMIDNLEGCSEAEIDFIHAALPNVTSCTLGYNQEAGGGEATEEHRLYIKEKLLPFMETIELEGNFISEDYLVEFSQMLFDAMIFEKKQKLKPRLEIERIPPLELRSEMLEKIGEKILDLIEREKISPSDIVILSSYGDPVTEYVIGGILEAKGYGVKNMTRKKRWIESPVIHGLLTLAKICYPKAAMNVKREDIKGFLSLLLRLDPVRSSLLAKRIVSEKEANEFPFIAKEDEIFPETSTALRYQHLRNWIQKYQAFNESLSISEFFQKAVLELFISLPMSLSEITEVKNLIQHGENFAQVVSKFPHLNVNKGFIQMVCKGSKAPAVEEVPEENGEEQDVLLTTPTLYLKGIHRGKVLILSSLSSHHWSFRSVKELTNPFVLSKTWDSDQIYSEELDQEYQKRNLAELIRGVIQKCGERLITFESLYSDNGYENNGLLSQYFEEIFLEETEHGA